jgi:hypothetical protein
MEKNKVETAVSEELKQESEKPEKETKAESEKETSSVSEELKQESEKPEKETKAESEKQEKESESESDSESDTKDTDSETDTEPEKEISWFQQIKSDFKKGSFPKVDPFGFLPPFPAATALQVMASLNTIFQENIGKVNKYANVYIDNEIAKKKHELDLENSLAEQITDASLKHKVDAYVDHVLR